MQQELNDFYRYHQEILVGGVLTRYFDSAANIHNTRTEPHDTNKPIVLALHGVATSSYLYRQLIPGFDTSVRLIIPDLPGFGQSTKKLPWSAKYRYYLDWLEGFIRSVVPFSETPVKAHFVGHDFGALLAMSWAVNHPQEVASLFCMNTCIHVEYAIPSPLLGLNMAPLVGQGFGRIMARDLFLPFFFKKLFNKLPDKKVLDAYMYVYRDAQARIILANFLHNLTTMPQLMWNIRRNLKHLTCHCTFMFGQDDILLRDVEARSLAEMMPNASYRCLPGIGHFPCEEAPAAVQAEFSAHLSQLGLEC